MAKLRSRRGPTQYMRLVFFSKTYIIHFARFVLYSFKNGYVCLHRLKFCTFSNCKNFKANIEFPTPAFDFLYQSELNQSPV